MEIRQTQLGTTLDAPRLMALASIRPHLVLVFGSVQRLKAPELLGQLRDCFDQAQLVGCSTSGEIADSGVMDDGIVVTAVRFNAPAFRVCSVPYDGMDDSRGAGERLAGQLMGEGLRAMWVLGQGVNINGSALLEGIARVAGDDVALAGGLAGDGGRFQHTWVLCNDTVSDRHVVGVGFYGDGVQLTCGSGSGWQPFGATRLVTRACANVLYELDGEPALEIYRRYLGEYAADLPASGLLFPFAMIGEDHSETGLIRTILGVDEVAGSLTLAGDIVEGGYLRLMTASTDALVDGAESVAHALHDARQAESPCLVLLVSCVGRKLVMGGRVEEEVEAVKAAFGPNAVLTGFYSNGEIGPHGVHTCQLHNQTMTITCLRD